MGMTMKISKNFKFICLIAVIIGSTWYVIRKVDPQRSKLETYFNTYLPASAKYQYITISSWKKLDSVDMKDLNIRCTDGNEEGEIDYRMLKRAHHTFRLRDTLFSASVYVDKRDSIVYVDDLKRITFPSLIPNN